jgi:dTDP-4-dehydrorhamnose 3,5-epimerase
VVRGNVFNVLVDMRRQSPTFGVWFGVELSMHRRSMVWSPPGFAHGVYVLSLQAEFVCKCTDFYHPQSEVVVRWNDPELDIDWPLLNGHAPILSPRDANGFSFAQAPKF